MPRGGGRAQHISQNEPMAEAAQRSEILARVTLLDRHRDAFMCGIFRHSEFNPLLQQILSASCAQDRQLRRIRVAPGRALHLAWPEAAGVNINAFLKGAVLDKDESSHNYSSFKRSEIEAEFIAAFFTDEDSLRYGMSAVDIDIVWQISYDTPLTVQEFIVNMKTDP